MLLYNFNNNSDCDNSWCALDIMALAKDNMNYIF